MPRNPSTGDLDAIDLRILDALQRDGRLSNVELARRVNLSPSPCLARVKALESDYLLRVVVRDMQSLERFIVDHLAKIPGVASIRSSFALKQVRYKTALPLGGAQS